MTPPHVTSASINSAVANMTTIIKGIRIGLGTDNVTAGKQAGFAWPATPRVFHRAEGIPQRTSYSRHRRLSISAAGTLASRPQTFHRLAYPRNSQQRFCHRSIIAPPTLEGFR